MSERCTHCAGHLESREVLRAKLSDAMHVLLHDDGSTAGLYGVLRVSLELEHCADCAQSKMLTAIGELAERELAPDELRRPYERPRVDRIRDLTPDELAQHAKRRKKGRV